MKYSKVKDMYGRPIPYGVLIDFTWWNYCGWEQEWHYKAKIRYRKDGDIFEFVENERGDKIHFTHKLSALNWTEDDLELL